MCISILILRALFWRRRKQQKARPKTVMGNDPAASGLTDGGDLAAVFVSHSRRDTEVVSQIILALEARGQTVRVDRTATKRQLGEVNKSCERLSLLAHSC
jgi:hypothetical protein